MRTMTVALAAAGMLLISSARADDKSTDEVVKALRMLNDAFAKPNPDVIRQLMTDDHQAVTPYYGVATKDDQIRTLPDLKLSEYKPGKETVKMVTPEVAIISYPLTLKGTFKGKPVPPRNHAVAVWVRRDGKWQEAWYQETALGPK